MTMAEIRYTEEQQAVLSAEGKIIVSASAGSGKTLVMIERMLKKILAGAQVDRMLALTFTNKAAAQMREKIRQSLIRRINAPEINEEERARLKQQLSRLPMAEISTIHSFCARFIRANFFLADVDGNFDIVSDDDADGKSMQSQALDQVFSELYETADPDFLALLSLYFRKKKDDAFKQELLRLYKQFRIRADYREELTRLQRGEGETFASVSADMLSRVRKDFAHIRAALQDSLPALRAMGNKITAARVEEVLSFLQLVDAAEGYYALCAIPMPKFSKKESVYKKDSDEKRKIIEKTDFYIGKIKDFFEKEAASVGTREEEEKRFVSARQTAERVAAVLLRFDAQYDAVKKERAKLDYNDLEHIALRLLSRPEVAEEMRSRFDYVFVDEYQDINPVQEKLISLVGGENIFLVGDVKQSIYGFRGSKSVYFTQKQSEYAAAGTSLHLSSNFRSADAVLSSVNRVFCRAMTPASCGIDYAAKPMRGGEGYGENPGRVTLHLLRKEETEKRERGVYSVIEEYMLARNNLTEDAQAREVLNIVEEELHGQIYDPDEKCMRSVRYGDIAVLARKNSKGIPAVLSCLAENGIPVSAAAQTNVCDFPEIRQITDILSLIDNAEQDIPLCSALLSAMGGLDNAALAAIRLRYQRRRGPFRRLVRAYARDFSDETASKLKAFFALLDKYVMFSHILSGGELIERLIAETGLETDWLSRDDGARRMERIRAFALLAQDKNVHDFLVYLKSLDYKVPVGENAGDDAVKVMTVHASKGLEFPVVILIDLNEKFHGADRKELLYSEKYGIAPRSYDLNNKLVFDNVLRRAIEEEADEEELKGELNILYVAMTRAKYSMHLVTDAEKSGKYADLHFASSFADFLPVELFADQVAEPYVARAPFERRQTLVTGGNEKLTETIVRSFRPAYPFAADVQLPVKSSASNLMRDAQGEEYYPVSRLVPDELSDAEKDGEDKTLVGTAYHAFLQYADFSADGEKELERLLRTGRLTSEQGALISAEKAKKILSMPVFKRLQDAQLFREQSFLVFLPANQILDTASEEDVLFQGFIDLLAVTPSGVEIVDYKYSARPAEAIRRHYAPQIKLYKKAAAKIMKIAEASIRATIVNIQTGEEIPMN